MADYTQRYDDNADGSFYVDAECIACDACKGIARAHFKLTDDFSHAIVYAQPRTQDEKRLCIDALEACPVDAIGSQNDK